MIMYVLFVIISLIKTLARKYIKCIKYILLVIYTTPKQQMK